MEQQLNYATVLKIFNTLPIGYYFGARLEAVLSETSEDSFINLVDLKIVISYPTILEKYNTIQEKDKIEIIIRTLLYHEVSHAILTPYIADLNKENAIIFNIFEDERIETVLKHKFLDVDFKWLISLTELPEEKNPFIEFFSKVRLRNCSEEENTMIDLLISKYNKLNKTSPYATSLSYVKDIIALFHLLTSSEEISKEDEALLMNFISPNAVGEAESSEPILTYLDINIKQFDNPSFKFKLSNILYRNKKIKGNENSVMAKTSGKLCPRLLTKPNNYKWFESSGDGSHFTEGKIKFNLFIDQSGSFVKNFNKVNSIIKQLLSLEREYSNFEFDLVTIDNEITYRPKDKRYLSSNEKRFYGNSLNPELFTIYRKLQNPKYTNVNIILFDGIATCDKYIMPNGIELKPHSKEQLECFKAFNHNNDIIISDPSNGTNLKKYCKNAKISITKDYSEKLEDILLKKIQILL